MEERELQLKNMRRRNRSPECERLPSVIHCSRNETKRKREEKKYNNNIIIIKKKKSERDPTGGKEVAGKRADARISKSPLLFMPMRNALRPQPMLVLRREPNEQNNQMRCPSQNSKKKNYPERAFSYISFCLVYVVFFFFYSL